MELRQLRYFIALAQELHFGRAAAAVHLTQPPLSKQIKDLENEIGILLFERNNRNVKITDPGKIFLEAARRVFDLLDDAAKTARRAQRGEVGSLAVGYITAAAYSLLPNVLRDFRKSHADLGLQLREMTTPAQCEALSKGSIDVGIMRPGPSLGVFKSEVILREPFVVAVPEEHKLARARQVDIRSLAQEPFIMLPPSPGGGLPRQILDLCHDAKFEPNVVQIASQTLSIIGLVAAGTGVAIVPLSVKRMSIANVVYRPLRGVKGHAETVIVWRKDGETPLVAQFLATIHKSAAVLIPGATMRRAAST